MIAFFDIDSPNEYGLEVSLHEAVSSNWKCAMVSHHEMLDKHKGLSEKYNFFVGDVMTIMHSLRSETMALIKDGSKFWNFPVADKAVHIKSSEVLPVDVLVQSLINLKMRAYVANYLLNSKKDILNVQTIVAPGDLWDKIFMVHARLIRERLATPDVNYQSLLINFCISLYDYDVVKI